MAITTVVGASSQTLSVTVDGSAAQNLANQYASAVAGIGSGAGVYNIAPGSVSVSGSGDHDVITTGGAYNIAGNMAFISAGSYNFNGSDMSTYSLTTPLALNLTGDTAANVSILAGDFGGVTVFAGNQNGMFVGGVGNNAFLGAGTTGSWNIATGNGNSTILGTNGGDTIADGLGQNTIFLGTGTNAVTSMGTDTIYGSSGTDSVSLLGGSSLVQLHGNAYVSDQSSANSITVGTNSTIMGGSSGTYFTTGQTATISGGTSDTISASGNLFQVGGVNNNISVTGSLQFLSGTGTTTISAGNSTIWGSTGLVASFNGAANTTTIFAGDQQASGDRSAVAGESFNASSSQGSLIAWAGDNQTVTGGTASDTLVGTTGNSTLTGGSGAANLFEFIKGYDTGNYTITDFGSAAGNLVGLNKYGMNQSDLTNILNNATVSGSNTTIQLDDKTTITFLNTTNLNSSDFGLW